MPGVINVGSSRSDYSGIVHESITSLFWKKGSPSVEIPADEIVSTFFVSTVSGKSQDIMTPVVTLNPPTALSVTVTGNLRDGGTVTGSPQYFTINYICERNTEAKITIAIKVPHSTTVEYEYIKQCSK